MDHCRVSCRGIYAKEDKTMNNQCPKCGSENIEGEGVVISPGAAEQECSCSDCGAEWVDYYTYAKTETIE